MNNIVKVARLHLVDRFSYTLLVWGVLAIAFVVNLAIFAVIPVDQTSKGNYTGGLLSIYLFMVLIGWYAATKLLPFALTLGVSRRTYYLGTVALLTGLCAAYSVALTLLWLLEVQTAGWGMQLHFFRVPWILDGAWYQSLITTFVLLSLAFLMGMWSGLIYRRFALIGTLVFAGFLALAVVSIVLVVTWRQWWPQSIDFLANLDLLAASGLVAIVAVIVAVGGYLTIRRIAV